MFVGISVIAFKKPKLKYLFHNMIEKLKIYTKQVYVFRVPKYLHYNTFQFENVRALKLRLDVMESITSRSLNIE